MHMCLHICIYVHENNNEMQEMASARLVQGSDTVDAQRPHHRFTLCVCLWGGAFSPCQNYTHHIPSWKWQPPLAHAQNSQKISKKHQKKSAGLASDWAGMSLWGGGGHTRVKWICVLHKERHLRCRLIHIVRPDRHNLLVEWRAEEG